MIARNLLEQIRAIVRPIQSQMIGMIARAVVQRISDTTGTQTVQIGVQHGESIDDAEHYHPYGLSSHPRPGADGVVLFPGGDRSHPIMIVVGDRRYRIRDLQPGEVAIHNDVSVEILLDAGGNVRVIPGAGKVILGSDTASDPVALKSDVDALVSVFNSHTHAGVTPGGGATAVPTPTASSAVGATKIDGI